MHRFDSFINAISERNDSAPLRSSPVPVFLPNSQDSPEETETTILGTAEGQTFIIEYRDQENLHSFRRITVSGMWNKAPGIWILVSNCHERQARRSFRSDRILQCIDYDGTVHKDADGFLADTFSLLDLAPGVSAGNRNLLRIKEVVRPHIVLLCALGLGDGFLADQQTEIIMKHCLAISRICRIKLRETDLPRLAGYIHRQRPDKRVLYEACYEMRSIRDQKIRGKFMESALSLVNTDEIKHPEERRLFKLLSDELAGIK